MANEALQLIQDDVDGRLVLRAPGVGTLTAALPKGRLVRPGDTAGVIVTLGVARTLHVPPGVAGRIENKVPERVHAPVSFGDVLYELSALGAGQEADEATGATAAVGGPVLCAPYSGRFWQRPTPGDPAFVAVGDRVEAGSTIGLLEVMKTFTHLGYPGDGSLPAPARIVTILVDDGAEVGAGDPIVEVEPA